MHPPDAQVLKSMHPAARMCTQGAGCTLNFEHCHWLINCDRVIKPVLTTTPLYISDFKFYWKSALYEHRYSRLGLPV